MSDNKTGRQNGQDELDLISLFERLFSFVRKYGLMIVLFAICGVILGYISFKSSPKVYASSLLLHSFTLTNTEQIKIIENWNSLLKNREYNALGERLNCDPQMLRQLIRVNAAETQKLYIQNNPNGFTVDVLVKDNAVLSKLQEGIVYGLENSDYIKARLISKRSNLTQLIEKVKTEIIKLDSTKRNIENNINSGNQRSSSFIIDASNINLQMISLNEKLLNYEEDLKFANAVQVFHKFETFQKPVSPKLFKSLLLGFIGGFAIGYLLAMYLYIRGKIRLKRSQS